MGEISTKNIVNKNMINKQEISTSSPLQRKVGFEFETGWDLFEYTGTETPLPQRKDITDDKQVRLEKNKYWFEGTNFKICADPYPNKNAIEFVTDPMNSLDEVATTMDGIRTKTDQLVGKISGEYFIHDEGGKKFYIKPDDDNMTAVPQVSFGIQLNQLPKMLDFSDSFNNTERKKNNLKESMDKINPADRASSSIDGVCYLIKRYIEDGKEYKYEYPKQITDGAILARTEFGKLLSLAVKKDGKSLINTKDSNYFPIDNWLDLFKDKYKSDQLLFAKDVESDGDEESLKDGEIYAKDLTINDWLKSIYEAAIDDTKQDKLTQVKDHEGLGALGKKTETVAGEEAGIFESRLHAPRSIPHTEWTEYAENWTKFVAKMTGADEQSLDKKKKGCYLTTACVDYMGLPDDCEELTVLRNFRDTYLINKENGKELINIYYEQAPVILLNIHNRYREEEEKILLGLYSIIKDCVNAIKQGNNEYAFGIYCDMVFKLHQQYGNY